MAVGWIIDPWETLVHEVQNYDHHTLTNSKEEHCNQSLCLFTLFYKYLHGDDS